jgi:UDP-2,3-diacylglucosamine pyrophosphatase LpxH
MNTPFDSPLLWFIVVLIGAFAMTGNLDILDIFKGKKRGITSVTHTTKASKLLVVCSGDWHLGSNDCDVEKLKAHLEWLRKTDCKIVLMGDLLEFATGSSIGHGWASQTRNPQEQLDAIYEVLLPVRHKILCVLEGNHERRASQSGLDVAKTLSDRLRVSYAGPSCLIYLRVGKENYTMHVQHGSSGARYLRTKMQALMKTADYIDGVDVFAMGHVHELASAAQKYFVYDKRAKTRKERTRQFVLAGHYLKYGGYSEAKNYAPGKSGSPNIYFNGTRHDIHVST